MYFCLTFVYPISFSATCVFFSFLFVCFPHYHFKISFRNSFLSSRKPLRLGISPWEGHAQRPQRGGLLAPLPRVRVRRRRLRQEPPHNRRLHVSVQGPARQVLLDQHGPARQGVWS